MRQEASLVRRNKKTTMWLPADGRANINLIIQPGDKEAVLDEDPVLVSMLRRQRNTIITTLHQKNVFCCVVGAPTLDDMSFVTRYKPGRLQHQRAGRQHPQARRTQAMKGHEGTKAAFDSIFIFIKRSRTPPPGGRHNEIGGQIGCSG